MKFFKKALLTMMAAIVLMAAVTGCSGGDTSWIIKDDTTTLSSGFYIANLLESYYQGYNYITDTETDIFKQKIEDKDASQWMIENATKMTKQSFVIQKKFAELGLSLPQEKKDEITQSITAQWEYSKDIYEKNGVSQESVIGIMENYYMIDEIFLKMYGTDGEKAVPEDEIKKMFYDKYYKVNYIVVPLVDAEGNPMLDEDKVKTREATTTYFERIKAGENFDTVVAEYEKSLVEADGGTETDLHDHTVKDPHALLIAKDGSDGFPEKFVTETTALAKDEVKMFEDDTYVYIAQGLDITANIEDFNLAKNNLLYLMKNEEFQKLIEEWTTTLDANITINDATVKKFVPKNLKGLEQ